MATSTLQLGLRVYLRYKDKFITVLFLTEHHAMKKYWGVEV